MPRKFKSILLSESSRNEEVLPSSNATNATVTHQLSPHDRSTIIVDSDDSDDCIIVDGVSSQPLSTAPNFVKATSAQMPSSSNKETVTRCQTEDECVECKTCGRSVPRASMQLHEGRCKPAAASSTIYEPNVTENFTASPTNAGADVSSVKFLKGLLPSWSTEHVQALLDSHNGHVEQSYEGALALAANGDPDSIPLAMRSAIVRSLTMGSSGSSSHGDTPTDSSRKRPRYEASTSSSAPLPPPEFSSYAFRLLQSNGASAEGNREATTLGALVPDNGRLIGAVVFNMMIDFDFLCHEIPALRRLRGDQLTIISGREQLVGSIPGGVHVHYPPLPEYGSHHSKGLLCYYEGGEKESQGARDGPHCVFVVCTANFLHVDVRMKTNGIWAVAAPVKNAASPVSCEFEDDLYSYFEHYNARNHAVKTSRSKSESSPAKTSPSSTRPGIVDSSRIRKYDFSAVRGVKLIASAPGTHAGGWQGVHSGPAAWRWGHLAMRRFLANLNQKKRSRLSSSSSNDGSSSGLDNEKSRRLVCQFTSMGNVHEKWLYHQFADSMVGVHDQDSDMRRYGAKLKPSYGGHWAVPLPIELVVPSVEKVRSSTEGYAGGGSIPLPHKNIGKDFVRPMLHRYDEGSGTLGRNRTLPHIKSYCVYSRENVNSASSSSTAAPPSMQLDYFLLTSANLSMAAWGQLQNCDKSNVAELKILSYELGVLFFRDVDDFSSGEIVPVAPGKALTKGERACPVPYELPAKPFGHYDEPWAVDGRYLEPDGFGHQWPTHIQLYGPECTSRQGVAPPPP